MSKIVSRGVIGQDGITAPLQHEIRKDRWYYLGASSDPKLVKVTRVEDGRFWYIDYMDYVTLAGKEIVIEDWIGQDLIARGTATKRRTIQSWPVEDREHTEYILDHADMREEDKQGIDREQALCEYDKLFPGAQGRFLTRSYFYEDAMREQQGHKPTPESVIAHYSWLYDMPAPELLPAAAPVALPSDTTDWPAYTTPYSLANAPEHYGIAWSDSGYTLSYGRSFQKAVDGRPASVVGGYRVKDGSPIYTAEPPSQFSSVVAEGLNWVDRSAKIDLRESTVVDDLDTWFNTGVAAQASGVRLIGQYLRELGENGHLPGEDQIRAFLDGYDAAIEADDLIPF